MSPGLSIAQYRVIAKVGEGGMGAVYRATDTRLNREVALKVVAQEYARDSQWMARFQREARVLASLNHPHIAAVYGLEESGGVCAIAMELVEGSNLAERMAKRNMVVPEALGVALQIAEALEHAHEVGIVHRDLKPANIKLRPDGVVKVLDFGLAKTVESKEPSAETATRTGVVMGTPAYMAPEQAAGQPVDRRVDIWAFGVVLFEMLSGRQVYARGTALETLASVARDNPPWADLPAETPTAVVRLLRRCLNKDPKRRLQAIGEARIALEEIGPEAVPAEALSQPKSAWLPWMVATLSLVIGVAGLAVAWLRSKPAEPGTVRFLLPWPEGTSEVNRALAAPQVVPSPDGRHLAFIARSPDGKSALWVRPIGSPSSRRLDQTDGAMFPFWSPNGQFVAFFADEKLKKVPVIGGSPQTICEARADARTPDRGLDGGTWNASGIIVFGRGGAGSPLMQVPATGGQATPTPATSLDTSAGETLHSWPQFLPDGRRLLYFAGNQDPEKSAIYIQELGSSKRILVMRNRLRAAWSPPGYLLFPREGILFAQRLDPKNFQLIGEPVPVAEGVTSNEATARSAFAVSSSNSVLVYRAVPVNVGQLTWYGRDGKRVGVVGKSGEYASLRLSPDEKSAALVIGVYGRRDLWRMDLSSGALSRLTNDGNGVNASAAVWSSDSARLAFNLGSGGGLLELAVASGQTKVLGTSDLVPSDWSPDNRLVLCVKHGNRLAVIPLDNDRQPLTISDTSYTKGGFRFAPDGRFVAYTSAEPGRDQIFVASFPSLVGNSQVSIDGGVDPAWRKDGRELYYRTADGTVMSADIRTGAQIKVGMPKPLFKYAAGTEGSTYAPLGDGQRFLVIETETKNQTGQTMVVANWTADLKQP
jgi:Tol biopolymer transport system component